jgi:hypothetical protein
VCAAIAGRCLSIERSSFRGLLVSVFRWLIFDDFDFVVIDNKTCVHSLCDAVCSFDDKVDLLPMYSYPGHDQLPLTTNQ